MNLFNTSNAKWLFAFLLLNLCSSRVSAQGFVWAQGIHGGSGTNNSVGACTTDENNNGFFVGSFGGTVDFDPGPGVMNLTSVGQMDLFILKKDAVGNLLWVKQISGIAVDTGLCYGKGIGLDNFGNVYVGGVFREDFDFDPGIGIHQLSSYGGYHSFVLKLDPTGNFIWVKDFGSSTTVVNLSLMSMKMDAAANIFFTCGFASNSPVTIDVDPGIGVHDILCQSNGDILIEKLDSAGNFIWAKEISGPDNQGTRGLALDNHSNIYITGQLSGTADFDPGSSVTNLSGSQDAFIAKYDSAGNFLWAGSITGGWDDWGSSITTDTFGNVIVIGHFGSGTVDLDPGTGIYNVTSGYSHNGFVLKLRNDGSFGWAKSNYLGGGAIAEDGMGNIYTSASEFVQKMDSSGNIAWTKNFGGEVNAPIAITLDNANDIYIVGSFTMGGGDFDPGPGSFLISGWQAGFIAKFCGESLDFAMTGGSDTLCGGGDFAELTTPFISGATYTWTCNGSVVQGANNNTITTTEPGIYEVFVDGGCPSASGAPIYVYNCDGNLTGIASTVKAEGVEVYPNPAGDVLHVQTSLENYTLTVLNTLGQVIERRVGSESVKVDVYQYGSGVYYLQIEASDGQVVSRKFVVGH